MTWNIFTTTILAISLLLAVTAPFRIGAKTTYDRSDAACAVVDFVIYLLLCGHIRGWL